MNTTYWSQGTQALLQELGSSPVGLTSEQAEKRLKETGPNALKITPRVTRFRLFLNQLNSPIIMILLFATILSAFLQDWADAIIILFIILGSAVLSFFQENNASNALEKLRAQVRITSLVLRDGKEQTLASGELVPGDVVILSAGNLVPADGRLLSAKDFYVNQSVLTGETFPVEKSTVEVAANAGLAERTNSVFMGTNVRSGSAQVLIVRTGAATEFGQIAKHLSLRPAETEFERGIRSFGHLLTEVMLILVLAVFAINVYFQKPIIDSLLFSIALAVGLTPQLLPAIININLSKGAQAMAKKGVIVRRLESIENFGSMNMLCTDKTGTLTEGVVKLDSALDSRGEPSDEVFLRGFLNAHFQTGMINPLDNAITASSSPAELPQYSKIDEIPYDFVRKRLSVVVRRGEAYELITKGALDNVLAVCSQINDQGKPQPLDEAYRRRIQDLFTRWSGEGYRVIGIAGKPVDKQNNYGRDDERDLIFEGFLLFMDPPKSGIQEVISDLEELGVELKIISGDNKLVAVHTAKSIGLAVKGVLTGRELDDMKDEALWHTARNTTLFAEVDPNQKERIILALKKTGNVVGYMGDGINDAPALHAADVSISVDKAVDVAKEAADFVLMEKDLAVLHQGVVMGRKTFANTLKYVFMATSANFGNMFSVAGASLFLPFLPMLPKQILLINFLTDIPEMTIASDNVDNVMIEKPRRWDINFIRRFMLIFGLLSSAFDYVTFASLLWLMHANPALFRTGWFIESVLSASIVVFAIRTRLPFRSSRPSRQMLFATAAMGLVAVILPYTPLASLMDFAPLPPSYLLIIGAIIACYFASAEILKRWFYRHSA